MCSLLLTCLSHSSTSLLAAFVFPFLSTWFRRQKTVHSQNPCRRRWRSSNFVISCPFLAMVSFLSALLHQGRSRPPLQLAKLQRELLLPAWQAQRPDSIHPAVAIPITWQARRRTLSIYTGGQIPHRRLPLSRQQHRRTAESPFNIFRIAVSTTRLPRLRILRQISSSSSNTSTNVDSTPLIRPASSSSSSASRTTTKEKAKSLLPRLSTRSLRSRAFHIATGIDT